MQFLVSVLVDAMVLTLQLSNPTQAKDYTDKASQTASQSEASLALTALKIESLTLLS